MDSTQQRICFIRDVIRGKLFDSYNLAHATVCYLRKAVAQRKWANTEEVVSMLRNEGKYFAKALPKHFIVGNMVKRILKLVREEDTRLQKGTDEFSIESHDSLQKLFESDASRSINVSGKQLRSSIIENIGEFLMELETCRENIASQAGDHITSGETVMTIGSSKTIEAFLKAAAKKHKFKLVIAECAPFYRGKLLMESLIGVSNIEITLISDVAMFATMAQVNKVVIGANAVFANGGLQAVCGTYMLCLAAKHFSVPVIVCASFYKLTPLFVSEDNQETFNTLESPQTLVPFSEGDLVGKLETYSPVFDYVSPDLVTLFITNVSGNVPSYIYRMLSELYHPDDMDLSDEK